MDPAPPILTVVTVVLNDLPGLQITHESLRNQTDRRFVWVAADGGSTDGSARYLAAHASELLWWRSGRDGGPFDGMNQGLRTALGSHILFLNAGDQLAHPGILATILPILESEDPDFLYGDSLVTISAGHKRLKPARSHRLVWWGMFTHHPAMVFSRRLVAALTYDCRFAIAADYAFTLDVLARASSIRRLRQPLVIVAPPGLSAREAGRGRHEQAIIRRERLKFCRLLGWCVTALQWLSHHHKRRLPILYQYFHYRQAPQDYVKTVAPPHDRPFLLRAYNSLKLQ